MIAQNFGEPIIPSDNAKQTEFGTDETLLTSGPLTDKATMDEALILDAPIVETIAHETPTGTNTGSPATLLAREESERLRSRWNVIQGKFVDEPRSAVEQADALVSEVVENITQMFASEHNLLEGQWNQGINVSTEDLRMALQHYRAFFNRLVV